MSSPSLVRSYLATALSLGAAGFVLSSGNGSAETKAKAELPISIAWASVPAPGAGLGRIRVGVAIGPIFDVIERNRGGRLRAATFSGSGATRVLDSRVERSFPFDMAVDRWVLELPVHWSSQDTWISVEVEETKSGARGRTMFELASAAAAAKPTGEELPMTLSLSGVHRTPFQSTGSLNLAIPASALASAFPEGSVGKIRVVVFETSGAGNSIGMPVHTKLPISVGTAEDWSGKVSVWWTELASRLTVRVDVDGTALHAEGSVRVNGRE